MDLTSDINNAPQLPAGGGIDGAAAHLPHDPSRQQHIDSLIDRIKESADRLAADQTTRGDLKILSRALRELRYAFKVFKPFRSTRKVTVFGSARTLPDQGSYRQAVDFGRTMANNGWLVVTGAASGIMEAGHVGAGRDRSMGINIMLPFEQGSNAIIEGDPKLVHMKYFFTRKLMFVKECDAVCLLPGGFGTMDEGFEVLTLVQTGKRDVVPLVFLDEPGGTFWREWQHFVENTLLANEMISPDDLSLFKVTDSLDEAVAETLNFYRVYHSMRYVREQLVIRLTSRPSDELMARLREEYHDILADGTIELSGALPPEQDEPDLAELPRLVLHFSRRNFGRLRTMIDLINREGEPAED